MFGLESAPAFYLGRLSFAGLSVFCGRRCGRGFLSAGILVGAGAAWLGAGAAGAILDTFDRSLYSERGADAEHADENGQTPMWLFR